MSLDELRNQIDEIDEEIVRLFVRRMDVVSRVAEEKQTTGRPVRDRRREEAVSEKAVERAGEEYAPYIRELYEKMFEVSRNFQFDRTERQK